MIQISRDDVLHLAQLSSLELNETEIDGFQASLSEILGYVEQLNKVNTDDVEPTYQVTGLENVWRDDQVVDCGLKRQDLLEMAPEVIDHQIKVPKVL
jgi:aspartyl-tRNA(Asn)/glutamyl-tRNA(Gln) amidotransferase subunit C